MKKKYKLLIGTPAYGSLVHTDYMHSVFSILQIPNVSTTIMTLGNESLITRARNKIFSYFVENSDKFTHLLFLDADVKVRAVDIYEMLESGKHLIAEPVRLKGDDYVLNYLKDPQVDTKNDSPFIPVIQVGTAVMLISQHLAKSVSKWAVENGFIYKVDARFTRGDADKVSDIQFMDVFRAEVVNGVYLSEDFYFCNLVRSLGFSIYVYLNGKTSHNGNLALEY